MGMMLTYRPGYWGDAPAAADEADVVAKPLSKRNLVELQETARSLGLSEDGSKSDLRDRIRDREAEGTVTAKPGDGQPGVDEQETSEGEQPPAENDPADAEDSTESDVPEDEQTEGDNPGE